MQCIIRGLSPNTDYVFAVQRADKTGNPVGTISKPSAVMRTTFPQPLLLCWCFLSRCAFNLGITSVALKSTEYIMKAFMNQGAIRVCITLCPAINVELQPLWEQNPVINCKLNMDVIKEASPFMLREMVRVIISNCELELSKEVIHLG